jgi:glutamine synthetase
MKVAEYIWFDVDYKFCSKIRVVHDKDNINEWNYDGSSTGQASTNNSEIILKPVKIFNNPFLDGYLVVCATYDINANPLLNNHFHKAREIFDKNINEKPWFGLEQEYFFCKSNGYLGHNNININIHNRYYCSPINQDQLGVEISTKHLEYCIKAGINISGINAEVVSGQWEFQIGPCEGIEIGHHMMAARYLLERIAIKENIYIDYRPKPIRNMNGSGCHINFSTQKMREENGLDIIMEAIKKLENNHSNHMLYYGKDNEKRMTGHHETASYHIFSWGVGTRNTSIRIGNDTFKNKKGYFEDRRPASNIDPYLATSIIFNTCCN